MTPRLAAVAGLAVLLVVGIGCSARPGPRPAAKPDAAAVGDATPVPPGADARAAAEAHDPAPRKPPARPPTRGEREREWIEKRAAGRPVLCYLFGEGHDDLLPLPVGMVGELYEEVRSADRADPMALARFVKRIGDLGLAAEGRVSTAPEGLRIDDDGKLVSLAAGRALTSRIRAAGALTLEAILAPADTKQSGPARIIGVSWDGGERNFTLGQERDRWSFRLRTSRGDRNGSRHELKVKGLLAERAHLAVTYDGGALRLYVNGRLVETEEDVRCDFDDWDPSYPLVLGDEYRDRRDWEGVVRFVAFYDRALTAPQVAAAAADPPLGDAPARASEGRAPAKEEVF
jgi:hypothetical protein